MSADTGRSSAQVSACRNDIARGERWGSELAANGAGGALMAQLGSRHCR